MPACASETVSPLWPSAARWTAEQRARASSSSASSCSSCSEPGSPRPGSPAEWAPCPESRSLLSRLLGWYPALVIQLARQMLSLAVFLAWSQIFLSAGLWILECGLSIPLAAAKGILSAMYGSRKSGRTVLITGSSIETLQVARNFYHCGARVIILEHDDKFGLVRFSTAVEKFYKVPSPERSPQEYVREVVRVAERENASYFVPTASSHTAHYDALVKSHLEQLGVTCVCPGVKDVWLLDDPGALLQLCRDAGLAIPFHQRLSGPEQLAALYEDGHLRRARHVLLAAGAIATREVQTELELPQTRRGFRRLVQSQPRALVSLCPARPALLVQIPEGERLVTCTTVREGHVLANITCRAPLPDETTPILEPLQRDDVDQWLDSFVAALPPNRLFTGHISFTLIATRTGVVPISARCGVSLPYLCYSSQQPRVFMRTCKHHTNSCKPDRKSLVLANGRYWLHDTVLQTARAPSLQRTVQLVSTLARKHEVLFLAWDPIPCFVFYGLQLPARAVVHLLHRPRRVVPQHPSPHLVHFSSAAAAAASQGNGHLNNNCKNGHTTFSLDAPLSPEDCGAVSSPLPRVNGVRKNGCSAGGAANGHHHTYGRHAGDVGSVDLIQL